KMRLKSALPKDLDRIADCHILTFQESLSAAMGRRYVRKMFEWYLSTDKAFLFLLEDNDLCIGYCGGIVVDGSLSHGSASSMAQYTFNQAVWSLLMRPWLFFSREFREKYWLVLRNIYYKLLKIFGRKDVRSVKQSDVFEPHMGLVVIGVRKSHQGKGLGTQLLHEFERITKEKGIRKMTLTVSTANAQAIKAYTKTGWSVSSVKLN